MSIVAPVTVAKPVPPGRHAIVVARLRWFVQALAVFVMAAWSLLLVAWLTLHWGILPHINDWRGSIAERISAALGVPVHIGTITARSAGWLPTLELHGVVLLDPQGREALALPRVVATLSARSALAMSLRFDQLVLEGLQLDLRRDANGRLSLAGLELGGAGSGKSGMANWLFEQPEFVIRGASLRWTDEQRQAPSLALTDMHLVVRNGLRGHHIQIDATPPAEWGERFSLRGRFTQPLLKDAGDWHSWSGTLYAELPRADVRQLGRYVKLPFELSTGEGALRAWLDLERGWLEAVTVDLALREVDARLANNLERLNVTSIEGRLSGQRSDEGWRMAAHQFGFVTGDGIRWPRGDLAFGWRQRSGAAPTGGEFSAQRLDLALIAQVASRVPIGAALRKLLAELEAQGIVSNLKARWHGALDAPRAYDISGTLSGLSLAARPSADAHAIGRPGLRNATIALTATERGGSAKLTLSAGAVEFPGVFEEPLVPLDQLTALLQWRVEAASGPDAAPQITLFVRDAKFANADAQGQFSGRWSTGAGQGVARGGRYPGRLEVDGTLSHALAQRVARYLPRGIPEQARAYVSGAVRHGRVSNMTVHVKGDLWDFPFHRMRDPREGEFRIAARVDDLSLAYVPDRPASGGSPSIASAWPVFERVSGQLVFDRASLEIRDAQASLYGVELKGVNGGIRNLADKPVLAMEGHGRGPLAGMLRYVKSSPVGAWIGHSLDNATGSGAADLRLALSMPLHDLNGVSVTGSMGLAGNDVRFSADTPLLGAARARVAFTQKGFNVNGASARVLGGHATFQGGTQPDGTAQFTGQGLVTAEGLRRAPELGQLSRLASAFSGQAAYRLTLAFLHGQPQLNLSSDLVGIASDLPAPLRKTAAQALPLRYANQIDTAAVKNGQPLRDLLRVDIGNVVTAHYLRDLSGGSARPLHGGIGVLAAAPTPASGVAAHINLANLDADSWMQVAKRIGASGSGAGAGAEKKSSSNPYAPTVIAVRAQEVVIASRRLNKVVAGMSQQDDGLWRATLDAEQLNGDVEYRPASPGAGSGTPGRVVARLSRMSLPHSDAQAVEGLLDRQLSAVPALDIVVDDLQLSGKRLGRLEIDAVNQAQGDGREPSGEWRLNRLALIVPEARFEAKGVWGSSSKSVSDPRRATLDFTLELTDGGALLERLGSGRTVRGGKGLLSGQVSWLGSPLALDYASLSGQIGVAVSAGQFLKVEPGAARLLSVLSMQSLPRRLALDFRDVFQQGFPFDNITGDVRIEQGVARTNNLRMRGVQAAVLMEGSADIRQETQDLRVIVVPEINAGTASLAYAAINPAIGIGTFVAQLFLRKPLTQAGTREFHVTGPWADPLVQRVQRPLGAAVPELDGASSSDSPRR